MLPVFQVLDVQVIRISAGDKLLGAVGIYSIHTVQLHGVVVLVQGPGQLDFASGVKHLVYHKILGSSGSMGLAVRKLQLAQVDLIAGHSLLACNLHTDGGNVTTGKVSQRELHGSPAIRLLACLRNREHHQGLGVILEAQDQGQVAQVVVRDLVVGQRQLAALQNLQVGLVQVDGLLLAGLQVAVNGQGGAAVVSANLLVVKGAGGAVQENLLLLFAVVPIQVQSGRALALHPPLPGGHKVLEVHVGPFHIPGDLAVQEVLHAMAVVEVRVEHGAIDCRPLRHIPGQALPHNLTIHADLHVGAVDVVERVIYGALLGAGVPHTLPLFGDPLIPIGIAEVVHLAVSFMDKVAAPEGQAHLRVAVVIQDPVQIFDSCLRLALANVGIGRAAVHGAALEPAVAALHAQEQGFKGIQTQRLRQLHGLVDHFPVPPVVQPHGIGHTALGIVHEPIPVPVIQHVPIANHAVHRAVRLGGDGIIPLNVNALAAQVLDHLLEQGDERRIEGALLVDEVAVKAVISGNLHHLLGIGELAVFILVQPLFGVLGVSGDEVLGNGLDTVFVSGVDEGGDGDADDAILIPLLLLGCHSVEARGGPAAGADVIGVLPELEQVVREIIVVLAAVPGGLCRVSGTVVAHGHVINLGLRLQVRVGLGGGEGLVALLQRNPRPELLSIVVGLRRPIQHIYQAVAVLPGLVRVAGLTLGCFCLGLCSGCGDAQCRTQRHQHHSRQHKGQQTFDVIFHFALLLT